MKEGIVIICFFAYWLLFSEQPVFAQTKQWTFQSIDTMKYSRDLARAKANDPTFDSVINRQTAEIAGTGANYIAIDTPYDDEFLPYLTKWVMAARYYHLHVWFRGNWSGWEQWFTYPKITREQHLQKTQNFILQHSYLFQDGDAFTACPECENGGPGDPRDTHDVTGFRNFMIAEYQMTQNAFASINKHVITNYDSMNGDVAKLIMDPATTQAMGGVVTVDHYVKSPEELANDLTNLHEISGGKIVLGEFGAPIPDLQGNMTDSEQADWIHALLQRLAGSSYMIGLNYWTSEGGTTAIWSVNGNAKSAVATISAFYQGKAAMLHVSDEFGNTIKNAHIMMNGKKLPLDSSSNVSLPYSTNQATFTISADGYKSVTTKTNIDRNITFTLVKEQITPIDHLRKLLHQMLPFLSF